MSKNKNKPFTNPLRLSKVTNEKYFYALNAHDAMIVRFIGMTGLVACLFLIVGFVSFLKISLYITVLMLPALVVIVAYQMLHYVLMALYPGFNVQKHNLLVNAYKQKARKPAVAVLIAAAGEDIHVVKRTAMAAHKIDYDNYEVFILDDTKTRMYDDLANQLRCSYANRQNIGEHKKAGNLNNALAHLNEFDLFLVLDADFAVRPEILNELVPYTGDDIGIVQSPQHFPINKAILATSKVQYGAAYIQRDFYRITQVARNRFGAAICVGTNALYNRKALEIVGGYEGVGRAGWGHSEDVNTGLKMLNAVNSKNQHFKIRYVPIQLAVGDCPDTHHSFYKQQNRWCTGSIQLLLSRKTMFSKVLSVPQKICYVTNSLYYFYTISLLLTPFYLLLITLAGSNAYSWHNTYLFLPSLLQNNVLGPYMLRGKVYSRAVSLVVLSNAYTFVQALALLIVRRPLGWAPTGAQSRKKSIHFTQYKMMASFFFVTLYLATLSVLIINDRVGLNASILITTLFCIAFVAHLDFLHHILLSGLQRRQMVLDRKFYAFLMILVLSGSSTLMAVTEHRNVELRASRIHGIEINRTNRFSR